MSVPSSNSAEMPFGEPLQPEQLETRHTYLVADTHVEPPQPIAHLTVDALAVRLNGDVVRPRRGQPLPFEGTWRSLASQREYHVLIPRRPINSMGALGVFVSHGGAQINAMKPGYKFFASCPTPPKA